MLSSPFSKKQQGITLLESLISIVIAALGIFGILAVQLRTLSDTQNSVRRTQAIRMIEDLSERMKVSPNGLANINSYVIGWATATGTPPLTPEAGTLCNVVACSSAELAAFDIRDWKRNVESSLPLGDANVFLAPAETNNGNRRQLGVMIRWRENERGDLGNAAAQEAYKNQIDTTKILNANNTVNDAGGAILCNDNGAAVLYTCHVQYIPVSARCDIFRASGSNKYYCPGE